MLGLFVICSSLVLLNYMCVLIVCVCPNASHVYVCVLILCWGSVLFAKVTFSTTFVPLPVSGRGCMRSIPALLTCTQALDMRIRVSHALDTHSRCACACAGHTACMLQMSSMCNHTRTHTHTHTRTHTHTHTQVQVVH